MDAVMAFNKLEDYPIVKCLDNERILCVQRQHLIILINQLLVLSIIILIVPASLFLILTSLLNLIYTGIASPVLILYSIFAFISLFLVLAIYLYLNWYYHFYVITNKAIIDRYSFRIAGPYSEVIFGEQLHVQEIIRKPLNIFYDFLKINDVYVYFHKLEKEEPFIFSSPQDSQRIEDLIEDLSAKSKMTMDLKNI